MSIRTSDARATGAHRPDDPASLGEAQVALLDFEARWWTYDQPKDELIRARFSMTAVRYYQVLNVLIDSPAALAHDPLLVRRLRRLRARRTAQRAASRSGIRS